MGWCDRRAARHVIDVHRTALGDDGLDEAVAALRAFAHVDRETSASDPSACARSA
jgi:hypothetical protein